MTHREPISKKLRFQVLRRDCFSCRYCGAKAGDAKLHIDHRVPVKHGGKTVIGNLYTACQPCNLGKGTMAVDDVPVPNAVMLKLMFLVGMASAFDDKDFPNDWMAHYREAYEDGRDLDDIKDDLIQYRNERTADFNYAFNGVKPRLEKPSHMKMCQEWVNDPVWRGNMTDDQVRYIREWRPN